MKPRIKKQPGESLWFCNGGSINGTAESPVGAYNDYAQKMRSIGLPPPFSTRRAFPISYFKDQVRSESK